MPRDVPSKFEVHAALERQVQLEKRRQREGRELLATLRHAQAHLLGIEVETLTTHTDPARSQSDSIEADRQPY